ncbi:UNVERIFIED_CONTAM: hypothetical protein K2H54_053111 [Gekko kuhli]
MGYWGFGKNGCQPCDCARDCDKNTGECLDSYDNQHFFDIPIGGRIPELIQTQVNESEDEWQWNDHVQGFSALRHPEKCVCKERILGSVTNFCQMKYAYVIKAKILSAHDKGTHAEVIVKVKKVLKSGKVQITRNNRSIYPESWTNRGCTCPILNPGLPKTELAFLLQLHSTSPELKCRLPDSRTGRHKDKQTPSEHEQPGEALESSLGEAGGRHASNWMQIVSNVKVKVMNFTPLTNEQAYNIWVALYFLTNQANRENDTEEEGKREELPSSYLYHFSTPQSTTVVKNISVIFDEETLQLCEQDMVIF